MCCYLYLFILSSAGSRSGSPGRVLTTTTLSTMNTGVQRVLVNPATAQKRSKIPRSQGCSREASPSRLSVGKHHSVTLGFFVALLTISAGYLQLAISYR